MSARRGLDATRSSSLKFFCLGKLAFDFGWFSLIDKSFFASSRGYLKLSAKKKDAENHTTAESKERTMRLLPGEAAAARRSQSRRAYGLRDGDGVYLPCGWEMASCLFLDVAGA